MNAVVVIKDGCRIRLRLGEQVRMVVSGAIRRGRFIGVNRKRLTVLSGLDVYRFGAKTLRLTLHGGDGYLCLARKRESNGLVRDRKKKAEM